MPKEKKPDSYLSKSSQIFFPILKNIFFSISVPTIFIGFFQIIPFSGQKGKRKLNVTIAAVASSPKTQKPLISLPGNWLSRGTMVWFVLKMW